MASKFTRWFGERWPFKAVTEWSLNEYIPGGDSFWYCFGATMIFVFAIQVITGIWQLFFYVPTVDHAYQSVTYLRRQVPLGWFIHGLHYWGSNVFILLVYIHALRVFIWGAYKSPRQLTWLAGVLLLMLVMALSFTGALLPWDELGYWAAEVGTSIAGTVPVIGFFIKAFLRGGAAMSQTSLSRFFIFHVAILPGILAALIVFHLVAFRQFGSVGPWDPKKLNKTGLFWPDQIFKDLIVISIVFVLLVGLAAFWRAPITGPADPLDNIITPKPEWQFLFLYQFLKLFKGRLEPVGTVGVPLVLFLILFFLPFYDRNKQQSPRRRIFAMAGAGALIAWFITYTILGYLSNPGASLTSKVKVSAKASAGVKAGAKLFSSQGCTACHTVNGSGGDIGPNLSNEGAKGHSIPWLTQQIRDPKSHDPSTAMPAFDSLSDKQVQNLVDFLESLGGSGAAASPEKSTSKPKKPAEPKTTAEPNKTGEQSAQKLQMSQALSLAQKGKKIFDSQSCLECHTVNGKGGNIGPNLSDEGTKGYSDKWLTVQIQNPKVHVPGSIMPSFSSLGDQKINEVAAYLQSLKGSSGQNSGTKDPPEDPQTSLPDGPNPSGAANRKSYGRAVYLVGNPAHGKLLFDKWCQRCHGQDGKNNIPNPGSDDGTVPPLNPIDREIYNNNPETFARNIDLYIQHGSVPAGPHPEKDMLAFGDDLLLTQEMISEVQAYILQLNGVDRAEIMHPGVKPSIFFLITLIAFGSAVLIIAILWACKKEKEEESPNSPQE